MTFSWQNPAIDKRTFLHEAQMPGVKQYRTSMKDVRKSVDDMFRSVLPQITGLIVGASDTDGKLDSRQRDRVLLQVGNIIEGLFVADGRFAFGEDGVTARTPFAQILNEFYVRVVLEAIAQQYVWMQRNIPEDVFNWLRQSGQAFAIGEVGNPFLRRDGESDEAFRSRVDDLRIFRPNPMVELDKNRQWVPMHKWNDPNGYRLSDRVWRASNSTRQKVDAMVAEAFANGDGALALSRRLERFILPSRANLRTNKPYGVNASFDAMRLARTEIARAANHAAFMSAYLNPYVDRIDVARSSNGDARCPVCPRHATIGIGGDRLREPYDVRAANYPIYHPHCMCHTRPVVTDDPGTVTMRLRAVMEDAQSSIPPSTTPVQAQALSQMLLHRALGNLAAQYRGQFALPGF